MDLKAAERPGEALGKSMESAELGAYLCLRSLATALPFGGGKGWLPMFTHIGEF